MIFFFHHNNVGKPLYIFWCLHLTGVHFAAVTGNLFTNYDEILRDVSARVYKFQNDKCKLLKCGNNQNKAEKNATKTIAWPEVICPM